MFSNEPALWQLGRHSYFVPRTGHDQQSTSPSERAVFGFTERDGHGRGGPGYGEPQVDKANEAGLRDVEEELHRGLQARQVSVQSVLRACQLLNDRHRFQ